MRSCRCHGGGGVLYDDDIGAGSENGTRRRYGICYLCRVEGTGPVVGGGGGSYCFCRASTTVSHGMHGIENVGVYSWMTCMHAMA